MDFNSILVKTNQFANLCNVSKQTVIYYDRLGLLKPKKVDNNGYRYYSLSQTEAFSVIYALKSAGMPLSSIREYLSDRAPDKFIEFLEGEQKNILGKIRELKVLEKVIEKRKKATIDAVNAKDIMKIRFERLNQEFIIISEKIKENSEMELVNTLSNFEKIARNRVNGVLSINGIVDKEKLKKDENVFPTSSFYIKAVRKSEETIIKPAGIYATIYYQGSFDDIKSAYKKLIYEIEQNNYAVAGNSYEDILLDLCTQKSEDELLIKIMIPVEKNN